MKIMTTAILAATLVASEFAYVAHERAQTEATEAAFKLMVFAQSLRSAMPPAPPRKPLLPGGAETQRL